MRLAHLADLHLGFRQFDRTTDGGRNTRETDVAIALGRAIDDVIGQRPDVVAIAGDVFHSVRPPNSAILVFVDQLARLRAALPEAVVVLVAGNHDTPRTTETGFILPLVERLGVHVALLEPLQLAVERLGLTITAVPSAAASRIPAPAAAGLNLLVLHAGVAGFSGPAPRDAADPAALEVAGWDYVALGDYHVAAQVGRRAWYSGSIEYTSTDPWGELKKQNELGVAGKGYLTVDLTRGVPVVTFRPIGPTRRFVDLPPIEGTGLGAEQLDAAIADRIAELGSLEGAVVRLVVREVTRDVRRALNHKQLATWKGQALNLQIDLRRAEHEISPAARASRFKQLDEALAEFLGARALDPAIDRAAFVERGLAVFQEVGLDPKRDPYTNEIVPGL